MRELTRIQGLLLLAGCVLMTVSAGCFVFNVARGLTAWLFLAGAVVFGLMQIEQRYEGASLVLRRLRRMILLADFCFVAAGFLMVEDVYHLLLPFFSKELGGLLSYVRYVHNNWVVLVLVGAVLELYATHRMSNELEREAKNS